MITRDFFNPFTPKSDQFQNFSCSLDQIIAYSDERDYTTKSQYLTYAFL